MSYLVWHALLYSTVAHHINNVANFVVLEVGGERNHALLLEIA